METARREEAQEKELGIWERIITNVADVLAEIAEAAALVRFGTDLGLATESAVLELGIGSMSIGGPAFASCTRAVGVDPVPRLAITGGDHDVDRFVTDLQQRTELLQVDAIRQLTLADASLDLIVCDDGVEHAQDPRAIRAEGRRTVRSGGRMLFGVNVFSAIGRLQWR